MSASPPRFISREGQARRRRQTSSLGQGMPGISTHLGNMLAILAPLLCSGDGGLSPLRIIDNVSRPHSWTVYVHRTLGCPPDGALGYTPQGQGSGKPASSWRGTSWAVLLAPAQDQLRTWIQAPHSGSWLQVGVSSRPSAGAPEPPTAGEQTERLLCSGTHRTEAPRMRRFPRSQSRLFSEVDLDS